MPRSTECEKLLRQRHRVLPETAINERTASQIAPGDVPIIVEIEEAALLALSL